MASGKIIFSLPGHADLSLPVDEGYAPQITPRQSVSASYGGVIRTAHLAPEDTVLSILLSDLTRAEYLSLRATLTAAGYSAHGMTIEDPFDTYPRMHYIRGLDDGHWARGDEYTCTLIFRQSAAESLPLGGNIIANPKFRDGTGWERIAGTDADITYVSLTGASDPADYGVQMADNNADWETILTEARYPVGAYLYTVSATVRYTQGQRGLRGFVRFYDADGDAILGSASPTETGWAEQSTYHAWLQVDYSSGMKVKVGDGAYESSGLVASTWYTRSATFGRSGGQVPASAETFALGIIACGSGSGATTWQATNYTLTVVP